MREFVIPEYCRAAPWVRSRFWLSAAKTGSPLHRDPPDNLIAQIFGQKQVAGEEDGLTHQRNALRRLVRGQDSQSHAPAMRRTLVRRPGPSSAREAAPTKRGSAS